MEKIQQKFRDIDRRFTNNAIIRLNIVLDFVNKDCKSPAISPVIPRLSRSAIVINERGRRSFTTTNESVLEVSIACGSSRSGSRGVRSKSGFESHIASCVTEYRRIHSRFRRAIITPCLSKRCGVWAWKSSRISDALTRRTMDKMSSVRYYGFLILTECLTRRVLPAQL